METTDNALPRGAGADAPQSEIQEGHVPLNYTEQNFNELVAANTAMQTEIASHETLVGALRAQIENLTEALADSRESGRAYLTQIKDLQQADRDSRKRVDEANNEATYQRERADESQRKLDRALGYIDAGLDAKLEHKDRDGAPQIGSPVGPDLMSIPRAYRRYADDGAIPRMAMAATELRTAEYPAKRY